MTRKQGSSTANTTPDGIGRYTGPLRYGVLVCSKRDGVRVKDNSNSVSSNVKLRNETVGQSQLPDHTHQGHTTSISPHKLDNTTIEWQLGPASIMGLLPPKTCQ